MMLLLFAALQGLPAQNFPPVNRPGTFADLRGSVERTCGVTQHLDVDALLDRERQAEWNVHGTHVTTDSWFTLGCARAVLAGERSPANSGALMDAGNSWAQGAERVMQLVLKDRPGDAHAAELLGLLALDDNDPDDLKAAAKSLTGAFDLGVTSPGALRACAELAARVHADAASRACSMRALHSGFDSTWHLLRMAQLSFRAADTVTGNKLFIDAASVARDSLARQEVNWHLQWFLTPDERVVWPHVADSARRTWLWDRVVSRDVRDGQPLGARVAEHFGRLEYVETNFRLQVSRRTREALRTGPSMDDSSHFSNDTLVQSACEAGMVRATPARFYRRWQTDFDDRGVVWMRYGAPTKRVDSRPSCSMDGHSGQAREVWLYELDGNRMLLNFEYEMYSGSIEATRLVEGVLGAYFCDVDAKRCGLTAKSFGSFFSGKTGSDAFVQIQDVMHLHQEDAAFISAATTTDDNSPRGDRNIPLMSHLHRLWDPLSAAPLAMVTYALPVKDLSVQRNADKRTTLIDFDLRQWDAKTEQWRDTSFSRHFAIPDTNLKRPNLIGFVTVASSPGVSAWSLVATQPDQRRGRAYDVATAGLGTGPLALSDIVLGAEAQGLTWSLHNVEIPLAPVRVLDHKQSIALYYQIKSDAARSDLKTVVSVYEGASGVLSDSAVMRVSFDQAVQRGINEIAPTLDAAHLGKGHYFLEVRVTDAAGVLLSRRSTPLELE